MVVDSTAAAASAAGVEPRVARFGATERRLHTIHGVAFTVMALTGLVLWWPVLAQIVSDRPLTKAVHLVAAAAWLTALALVVVLGDRGALRATRREMERFDDDDLRWLRRRPAPQGRFNAGQKAHAIVQAALALLFTVSGVLLWLGERDTDFRLPGAIALHDAATLLACALVVGHVYMALSSAGALEGITRGTVTASYAADHHEKWRAQPPAADATDRRAVAGVARIAAAAIVVAAGIAAVTLLV